MKCEALDVGEAVLNMISNILFSTDLAHNGSESCQEFKELILWIVDEAGSSNVADFLNVCSLFDPQGVRARMTNYFEKVYRLIDEIIEEKDKIYIIPSKFKNYSENSID